MAYWICDICNNENLHTLNICEVCGERGNPKALEAARKESIKDREKILEAAIKAKKDAEKRKRKIKQQILFNGLESFFMKYCFLIYKVGVYLSVLFLFFCFLSVVFIVVYYSLFADTEIRYSYLWNIESNIKIMFNKEDIISNALVPFRFHASFFGNIAEYFVNMIVNFVMDLKKKGFALFLTVFARSKWDFLFQSFVYFFDFKCVNNPFRKLVVCIFKNLNELIRIIKNNFVKYYSQI